MKSHYKMHFAVYKNGVLLISSSKEYFVRIIFVAHSHQEVSIPTEFLGSGPWKAIILVLKKAL